MILPQQQSKLYETIKELGGEAKSVDIYRRAGISESSARTSISRMVKKGVLVRTGYGVYSVKTGGKTLSTELGIPHAKTVTPVAGVKGVELSPQSNVRDPAAIMLEVIARSPRPSKYAGVIRELVEVLD